MHREKFWLYAEHAESFRLRLLRDWVFPESVAFDAEYIHSIDPVPFAQRMNGERKKAEEGTVWGHAWESAWFHLTATIPDKWKGRAVVARINLGGEALVFDETGCPVYGLTSCCVFDATFSKEEYPLTSACAGGEAIDLWVEAAANELFGIQTDPNNGGPENKRHGWFEGKVRKLSLSVCDTEAMALAYDLEIALNLIKDMPEFSARRTQLIQTINDAIVLFAEDAAQFPVMRKLLGSVLYRPAHASDLTAISVGHAHIDTGWLWRVRETIRKCGRTFASQVALLEKYPEYIFGASQAQHFQFTKDHYPALYEKIKKYVAEGRWEVQGGMWVEADCNLISGESMVRQFVHGKNFFKDEFDLDVRTCWIPDVFGYSAAMPQIMKGCGVDYFLTQKISWSQMNKFPHNTFLWRGLDGTEVLTHFPPENNYNCPMLPASLIPGQERLRENNILPEFMSLFGLGDGGGGPTERHLERGRRLQNTEGCPPVRFGRAIDFFDNLATYAHKLSTWVGELYLETHRATLTAQGKTKRNNRIFENRLREIEYLATMHGKAYPREALDKLWKTLLINQFHDIIPGSSIRAVYEDTEREHAEALATCDTLLATLAQQLFPEKEGHATVVHTLSEACTMPVELPESWAGCAVLDEQGTPVPVQHDTRGSVALVNLKPQDIVTLKKGAIVQASSPASDSLILENDLIRYTFDTSGALISAWDKEDQRECLAEGQRGNILTLYNDRPNQFDAWDIDVFYELEVLETAKCTAAKRIADGPVRQILSLAWTVGKKSTLRQDVVLSNNSKRLEFRTEADWHEDHVSLRVAFPVAVHATEASFDIQYGYTRRPTHRNTSWDMAKFEVAAHTYADLSDMSYGVALLNDCKYGHKIFDNVIDLHLLRAPTHPDPDADRGNHIFTYALLPHIGTLTESDVMREATQLNRPPRVFDGCSHDGTAYPYRWDGAGVSLEVVKFAEKEEVPVLRLVERYGTRSSGALTLPKGMILEETNLIEWEKGSRISPENSTLPLTLTPFQIRTFRVLPA